MKTELTEAISVLKDFPNVDDFVARNVQQSMYGGEPIDNSIELGRYWHGCLTTVLNYATQSNEPTGGECIIGRNTSIHTPYFGIPKPTEQPDKVTEEEIRNWIKRRYSDQLTHTNIDHLVNLVQDVFNELINKD